MSHTPACWASFVSPTYEMGANANERGIRKSDLTCGSSPRVRGTRRHELSPQGVVRFIPACAGNAAFYRNYSPLRPVHPRVCGERFWRFGRWRHHLGSSPRVRGTPAERERDLIALRFIPACAGNACRSGTQTAPRSVHPRVCGERFADLVCRQHHLGSSPRVRGTLQQRHAHHAQGRFIPECAGNAQGWNPYQTQWTVHPRVCGERSARAINSASAAGSSPRVRGTHRVGQGHAPVLRFIPACAGNA